MMTYRRNVVAVLRVGDAEELQGGRQSILKSASSNDHMEYRWLAMAFTVSLSNIQTLSTHT